MKKNLFQLIILSLLTINSFAQFKEVEPEKDRDERSSPQGFQKDHLFTGGSIQLSYSNYSFVVGGSPVFGYSFNKWFDAGIGLNFTYISDKVGYLDAYGNEYTTGDKIRQVDIAPIAFAKFYPLKFLYIQAQGEQNIITQKYIYADGQPTDKLRYGVTSLLLGAGYCGGREDVGDFFYYFSLSFDVLKDRRSPYVQQNPNGSVSILPILRAGIQIPLFQGKR